MGAPGRVHHLRQIPAGDPIQFGASVIGRRERCGRVAGATRGNFRVDIPADGCADHIHHLAHRASLPAAHIEHIGRLVFLAALRRGDVRFGEIGHMDVVADAVPSGVG